MTGKMFLSLRNIKQNQYKMKTRLLLLLIACALVPLVANAKKPKKPKKVFKQEVVYSEPKLEISKLIKITFVYDSGAFTDWLRNFVINNGTDDRIYIEWENARINNSKVVLGDQTQISMRNQIADEVVIAGEPSISRNVSSLSAMDAGLFKKFIDTYALKKEIGKKGTVNIMIPIRYADNTTENFKITITCWYEEVPQEQ